MESILYIIIGACLGWAARSAFQIRWNRKMIKGLEETKQILNRPKEEQVK